MSSILWINYVIAMRTWHTPTVIDALDLKSGWSIIRHKQRLPKTHSVSVPVDMPPRRCLALASLVLDTKQSTVDLIVRAYIFSPREHQKNSYPGS
jgi:hypothetical protein